MTPRFPARGTWQADNQRGAEWPANAGGRIPSMFETTPGLARDVREIVAAMHTSGARVNFSQVTARLTEKGYRVSVGTVTAWVRREMPETLGGPPRLTR